MCIRDRDNTQTNNITVDEQELDNQLDNLLSEMDAIEQKIEENSVRNENEMNDIERNVDESIAEIKDIHADLDQIEKEAGDELDELVLQQVDELTRDDSDEE